MLICYFDFDRSSRNWFAKMFVVGTDCCWNFFFFCYPLGMVMISQLVAEVSAVIAATGLFFFCRFCSQFCSHRREVGVPNHREPNNKLKNGGEQWKLAQLIAGRKVLTVFTKWIGGIAIMRCLVAAIGCTDVFVLFFFLLVGCCWGGSHYDLH